LENDKANDILNYIKRINYFPNAYRIMLTISVSVASAVNNFSISCFRWKEFFKI